MGQAGTDLGWGADHTCQPPQNEWPQTAGRALLGQGTTRPVHCLKVCIAQVQLAAHQHDGGTWAEVLDFWVPHGLHVPQRVGVGQGEAEHHHIRSVKEKRGRGDSLRQGTFPPSCRDDPWAHQTLRERGRGRRATLSAGNPRPRWRAGSTIPQRPSSTPEPPSFQSAACAAPSHPEAAQAT